MKKTTKLLIKSLDLFIGQKCVKAEIPVGSSLYIHFGSFVKLFSDKPHPKSGKILLSTEYYIMFDWNWTMVKNSIIIASNRIENVKQYNYMNKELSNLKDKKLQRYEYFSGINEIVLYFEGDYILKGYHNITKRFSNSKYYDYYSVFAVSASSDYFVGLIDGKVECSKINREVLSESEYQNDPDKYSF